MREVREPADGGTATFEGQVLCSANRDLGHNQFNCIARWRGHLTGQYIAEMFFNQLVQSPYLNRTT